ncbi:MAG: DUF4153 domain-containing protein, partial [Prevotellaceae bacterium]|nr:DUF4153 domain-containing protein [Prevotellaceae bacterium]
MDLPNSQKKNLFKRMVDSFIKGCRRFPLAILLLFCWAVGAIIIHHLERKYGYGKLNLQRLEFFIAYYFPSAALLVTAFTLYREANPARPLNRFVAPVVYVAWLAFCSITAYFIPFSITNNIMLGTLIATIIAVTATLAFRHSKDDREFWRLIMGAIIAAVVAGIGAGIFFGGLQLLLIGVETLFGISFYSEITLDIIIVCYMFICPVVWLQMLPSLTPNDERTIKMPRFLGGLLHFLFMPLVGAYLITLYVYLFKIVFTWELPEGMVSYLVTALMAGTIAILFCLYPTRFEEGHRFDKLVARWLPILMLPLLILMTVGIVRRLSDYGLTMPRLYVLTFNLWCYGVCLWLVKCKGSRVIWIPVSFAAVLFVTSVGPQNYSNLAKAWIKHEVRTALKGKKLPLNERDYDQLFKSKTPERRRLLDQLAYLSANYQPGDLTDIMDSTAYGRIYYFDDEDTVQTEDFSVYGADYPVFNIQDYATMVPIDINTLNTTLK